MSDRKAFADTKVPVERSRGEIVKILQRWGAAGVQWEDDLQTGSSVLRFRWAPRAAGGETIGPQVVARLRLVVNVRGIVSAKAVDKLRDQERRRLHRVAFHWLRAQQAAIDAGLFAAETVILPWIEDSSGRTLGEILTPSLGLMGQADVGRRLMLTTGGS